MLFWEVSFWKKLVAPKSLKFGFNLADKIGFAFLGIASGQAVISKIIWGKIEVYLPSRGETHDVYAKMCSVPLGSPTMGSRLWFGIDFGSESKDVTV